MTLARDKAVVFASLGTITAALYFGTPHVRLFDALVLAPTTVDEAIPFVPLFVLPYLSFFLLLLLPLLVISDREEMRDVTFGFGMIVVLSSVMFLFWPTTIPYSDVHPLTRGVIAMDVDRNAFPSLHASLALYCALCARRTLQTALARYSLFLWTSLVVVSALLIKRHLAVDIAGGALLGWAMHAALFRPHRAEAPDSEPVVETLRIRRRLAREASDEFAAFTRYDGRKRAAELVVFLALAGGRILGEHLRPLRCIGADAGRRHSRHRRLAQHVSIADARRDARRAVRESPLELDGVGSAGVDVPDVVFGVSRDASPPSSIPRRPARSRRLP